MLLEKLFNIIDGLVGKEATFKGLAFSFENGVLVVDIFSTGYDDDYMFICDFIPHDESLEPVSFAAKGIGELKDQIEYYVTK